jgi:hypothetical protein
MLTSLMHSTPFELRDRVAPNLIGNLGIINCDGATADAADSKHRLKVSLGMIGESFVKMMNPQRTLNLLLSKQLHIVSNNLNKAILSINFLRVIDVQPTWMHIKDHIW